MMGDKKLTFSIQENRDLFKSNLLIGKKIKAGKYKNIFKNSDLIKILNSESMNETIDAFMKGGLNLTKASANSYVHRNTLIYRLDKVKRAIGLDLRKFQDCVIFMNMREVYKMVSKYDV